MPETPFRPDDETLAAPCPDCRGVPCMCPETPFCAGSRVPAVRVDAWTARCAVCGFTYATVMDEPITAPHRVMPDGRVVVGGAP